MGRISDILAAAAELSPKELSKLCARLERMEKRARAIVLKTRKGLTFRLCRLTDAEYWEARQRSLPIEDEYDAYLDLEYHKRERPGEALNLAEAYLTLKHLSGESGRHLDEVKMSFSFPFAMDVIKGKESFPYVMDARNVRDTLYFSLRRVVAEDDIRLRDGRYLEPFEGEFGREEYRYFIHFFHGYLTGRWKVLRRQRLEPFVRRVPSDLIVFGYSGGKAFEEQYESEEQYEDAWKRFEESNRLSADADDCFVVA